ncbi:GNAT family N-acetyltransferase [Streptomyces sp. NPDC002825]|uniref:GNAT family N-acetyltransferase n=1 Tax=Streptomyces sp. NPDC002825 TaxID=3154666 RepID=UPI00332FAE87
MEDYYDAVPRSAARTEEHGPLTLFVRNDAGIPFYARPARTRTGAPVTVDDVLAVRARQRELGVPESFEWVAELAPGLRAAVEGSGLPVSEHPLMVLAPQGVAEQQSGRDDGIEVRCLERDDPALPSALALLRVAFGAPGTAVGTAGVAELDAIVEGFVTDGSVERMVARMDAGLTRVAAAVAEGRSLCSGRHQPVGTVSEIVGVGTLPAQRRRGLGLAVTAALVADARARGVETVFLSASDDAVAGLYERLGFRRVGTALIAEPAE